MNKLVCLKTLIHITSCSRDSRNSRETLKYGTFGREKFGFRNEPKNMETLRCEITYHFMLPCPDVH